jgi:ubiquitin-like 1-activating enzyme E1 B
MHLTTITYFPIIADRIGKVDLDTIELSNLNRQFLFRRHHIKQPKSIVAVESAARFRPDCNLHALHGNIKDTRFNEEWFGSFDIVFNALDNIGIASAH